MEKEKGEGEVGDRKKDQEWPLRRATDRQLSHLLQDALDLRVELSRGVVVPDAIVKVALHARELLVSLFSELALHADHRLEARVKVRHALLEQDRHFAHDLVVEQVEDLLGLVQFLLRLPQPSGSLLALLHTP
jgi:hypothetical protein